MLELVYNDVGLRPGLFSFRPSLGLAHWPSELRVFHGFARLRVSGSGAAAVIFGTGTQKQVAGCARLYLF